MTDSEPRQLNAWVTGASSGLGRATALRLAQEGWSVAVSARRTESLEELARSASSAGGTILPVTADVTDPESVKHAVETIEAELGPIDLAILNAGTHIPMTARDFSVRVLGDLIETNLMGTAHCLEVLLPGMIARRRGHLAIVGSLSGYVGLPTAAAYGATKAGLINMSEALKPELDKHGIKIQIVNPGFVRTPLTDRNTFKMPFLMDVEDAVEAFVRGLKSSRFEITFPWRLALTMKLLRLLPYSLMFAVTRRLLPKDER